MEMVRSELMIEKEEVYKKNCKALSHIVFLHYFKEV